MRSLVAFILRVMTGRLKLSTGPLTGRCNLSASQPMCVRRTPITTDKCTSCEAGMGQPQANLDRQTLLRITKGAKTKSPNAIPTRQSPTGRERHESGLTSLPKLPAESTQPCRSHSLLLSLPSALPLGPPACRIETRSHDAFLARERGVYRAEQSAGFEKRACPPAVSRQSSHLSQWH